jgi:hypothetical protein
MIASTVIPNSGLTETERNSLGMQTIVKLSLVTGASKNHLKKCRDWWMPAIYVSIMINKGPTDDSKTLIYERSVLKWSFNVPHRSDSNTSLIV